MGGRGIIATKGFIKNFLKTALARWLNWLEHHPVHEKKVAGLIPSQGTYIGCRFDPQSGRIQETTDQCFSPIDISLSP